MTRTVGVLGVGLIALACQLMGGIDHCGLMMNRHAMDACCPAPGHLPEEPSGPCADAHLAPCCHAMPCLPAVVDRPMPVATAVQAGVSTVAPVPMEPGSEPFRPPIT